MYDEWCVNAFLICANTVMPKIGLLAYANQISGVAEVFGGKDKCHCKNHVYSLKGYSEVEFTPA